MTPTVIQIVEATHLGFAQIEVHLVIGDWNWFELIVLEPVELQLEGQSGHEMTIDDVLFELVPRAIGEVLRELPVAQNDGGHSPDATLTKKVDVVLAEPEKKPPRFFRTQLLLSESCQEIFKGRRLGMQLCNAPTDGNLQVLSTLA